LAAEDVGQRDESRHALLARLRHAKKGRYDERVPRLVDMSIEAQPSVLCGMLCWRDPVGHLPADAIRTKPEKDSAMPPLVWRDCRESRFGGFGPGRLA
jgi:hypothetical protein